MWLIERGVFPAIEEEHLVAVLDSRDVEYILLEGPELETNDDALYRPITRGSCWLVRRLADGGNWRADLFGHPDSFNVSNYLSLLRPWLLNAEGQFCSFAELCFTRKSVFAKWGASDGAVFVRPDTWYKTFEGSVVRPDGLDAWVERLRLLGIRDSERVWVAPKSTIQAEWRCVVFDGHCIAGSRYRPSLCTKLPRNVHEYVNAVASHGPPLARTFVVDVAETNAGLKVIEIGCAACVAFYLAEVEPIVACWEDVRG